MQIVIPMSGFGERFRLAGYKIPKALIEIDGKPLIAHVVDMFPGETNVTFICNEEHLNEPSYQMESILKHCCPSGRLVGIPPHKLGPVNAVAQVEHLLDPEEPVIVNYCDFSCYWDWSHFKRFVGETNVVGAIPAYKGFHPHSLGNTNYAYIRETNGWIEDIREKQSFTRNRMDEYASSGTYYFSSLQIMSDAFSAVMKQNLSVEGEFYVSLAYKPLLERNERIAIYPLQHFMQWGTPQDVAEYRYWSEAFKSLVTKFERNTPARGTIIVPMAGAGQRFADEGYTVPKPLISVSGVAMVAQAVSDLPPAEKHIFVLRTDMVGYEDLASQLRKFYPSAIIRTIEEITEGQACTALVGVDALDNGSEDERSPITIGSCDNGAIYDLASLNSLMQDPSVDVIVWGARGYPNAARNPQMFGWIDSKDGIIHSVSVKAPLNDPATDSIITGTFTFRRARDFRRALDRLVARNGRINGEFYIDSMINDSIALGLRCHLFEVETYLCWGTPNDLRTFEYWQSCFHKWCNHPYHLTLDKRLRKEHLPALEDRFKAAIPTRPETRD